MMKETKEITMHKQGLMVWSVKFLVIFSVLLVELILGYFDWRFFNS